MIVADKDSFVHNSNPLNLIEFELTPRWPGQRASPKDSWFPLPLLPPLPHCLRSSLCLGSRVTWFWWHFYFNHPTILRGSSHITISCQVIHLLIYTFLWSRLCHRFLCLRSFPSWGQSTVELSGTSWGFWYWYLVFGIWYMVFGMNYGSWTLKLSWGQLRSSLYQLG